MECIFCSIVAKTAEVSIVYEDEKCMAFLDIQPVNPGHTLIIPKEHFTDMNVCPEEIAMHLMAVAKKINAKVSQSLKCEGILNLIANGEAAGQEVFHLHLHVVPRFDGDGFGFKFSPNYGVKFPTREELDDVAHKISVQS